MNPKEFGVERTCVMGRETSHGPGCRGSARLWDRGAATGTGGDSQDTQRSECHPDSRIKTRASGSTAGWFVELRSILGNISGPEALCKSPLGKERGNWPLLGWAGRGSRTETLQALQALGLRARSGPGSCC